MYLGQESMGFEVLVAELSAGPRAAIAGIAERALRAAGVQCDPGEKASSLQLLGRETLQALPGIQEAQTEVRAVYDRHFTL